MSSERIDKVHRFTGCATPFLAWRFRIIATRMPLRKSIGTPGDRPESAPDTSNKERMQPRAGNPLAYRMQIDCLLGEIHQDAGSFVP